MLGLALVLKDITPCGLRHILVNC